MLIRSPLLTAKEESMTETFKNKKLVASEELLCQILPVWSLPSNIDTTDQGDFRLEGAS